jgi:hypothetical protein
MHEQPKTGGNPPKKDAASQKDQVNSPKENLGSPEPSTTERRPAVAVKNKVDWVNPHVETPFSLSVGQPSDLGVFLVNAGSSTQPAMELGVSSLHGRSALVGEIATTDDQGNHYHFVDLKGVGHVAAVEDTDEIEILTPKPKGINNTWGTWRHDRAVEEKDIGESMADKGVRTVRLGAIITLEEIALPDGTKIDLEEARSRGIIRADEIPAVGVRVSRMRERIDHDESQSAATLAKAKQVVEEELGYEPGALNWDGYINWFATTLGQNVALVHNNRPYHGSLGPHNITLACEVFDFIRAGSEREAITQRQNDPEQAKYSLHLLAATLRGLGHTGISNGDLDRLFNQAYTDNLR